MPRPEFFDAVPRLRMHDPLAQFLGAADDDGVIEYGYGDAVKLTGHSCPTAAGAYGLTRQALRALYGADLPQRGAIRVEFRTSGVIANVVSLLTSAAGDTGFKATTPVPAADGSSRRSGTAAPEDRPEAQAACPPSSPGTR